MFYHQRPFRKAEVETGTANLVGGIVRLLREPTQPGIAAQDRETGNAGKPQPVVDSPAQARGAIQEGRTGDKTPGFDPAVAPMEADAEAGGMATQPTREPPDRNSGAGFKNSATFGNAMRPTGWIARRPGSNGPVWSYFCSVWPSPPC